MPQITSSDKGLHCLLTEVSNNNTEVVLEIDLHLIIMAIITMV